LRIRAGEAGADALIRLDYKTEFGSIVQATWNAIIFKNREEALKKLKQIGANLE
jgi:hypothetical protein